jgi:transposase InsO family protein
VHEDLVRRVFGAKAANELWFADITSTRQQRASFTSARSRTRSRAASSALDRLPHESVARVAALNNAIALRGPVGTIAHSDRGSQFRSGKFVRALPSAGLVGSMGRTGACADNAAMESFFALLQNNVFNRQRWQTREELRDRALDRTRLSPPTSSEGSRQAHPGRVRSCERGCLCGMITINPTSQLKWGQSREHLGYMFTGLWTALVGIAVIQSDLLQAASTS